MTTLDVRSWEWHVMLVRHPNSFQFLAPELASRLDHEVGDWLMKHPDISMLFWSPTEWLLGLSREETDQRLALAFARAGANPFLVFVALRSRYQAMKDHEANAETPPSDRQLDGVVYLVFALLFEEELASGRPIHIGEDRADELMALLTGEPV